MVASFVERNCWVRGKLLASGDDLTAPRWVTLIAFQGEERSDATEVEVMANIMASCGYRTRPGYHDTGSGLRIAPSDETFDRLAASMKTFVDRHGWVYGGWDTNLVVNGKESITE